MHLSALTKEASLCGGQWPVQLRTLKDTKSFPLLLGSFCFLAMLEDQTEGRVHILND